MLKNLIELGRDVKEKFDNFNNWQELNFNSKDKEQLGKLDHVTQVFNKSIKFEFDSNHTIIPSQYILYALTIKDFALGLKAHLDIFDLYKNGKDRNQIGNEITNQSFDRIALNVDDYSRTILMEPIINTDYNFNAKSIINGRAGDYKVRGTSDFFASVILKIINVPDASSAILGKLIYSLSSDPELYSYLESRFIEYLPYLVQDSKIKTFARKTFAYLEQYDNLKNIKDLIVKNSDASFSSIKLEDISLTSIFKTSTTLLSEDNLKQGGKLRYFSDPLFYLDNEFYYFSTEWTDGTESRLDLESLKLILASTYPQFSIVKENSFYQLISSTIKINRYSINQIGFDIKSFQDSCKDAGLVYSDELITRFVGSLLTKPFVILTGLSGSGKTKLAQAYVQWICQEESQYRIIPVGADWTNREPLLGYPNALKPEEYVKPDSGVIDLILQANSNPELPHFLILDEMNLSHVERYFADFLSVMESNEEIPLYAEGSVNNGVPSKLKVPANLFIIGTVNIDETTNMFSPKVLDRANTIEFRINNNEMKGFLGTANDLNMKALLAKGATMAQSFISLSNNKSFTTKDLNEINKTLLNFFGELQKIGAEFGYRSATEILRLINQLDTLNNKITTSEKIDIAIMQKLLPKLHGSRRKLSPILETLGSFCLTEDIKVVKDVFDKDDFDYSNDKVLYPLSLEKIARMYKGAVDNGFASYAEA